MAPPALLVRSLLTNNRSSGGGFGQGRDPPVRGPGDIGSSQPNRHKRQADARASAGTRHILDRHGGFADDGRRCSACSGRPSEFVSPQTHEKYDHLKLERARVRYSFLGELEPRRVLFMPLRVACSGRDC